MIKLKNEVTKGKHQKENLFFYYFTQNLELKFYKNVWKIIPENWCLWKVEKSLVTGFFKSWLLEV